MKKVIIILLIVVIIASITVVTLKHFKKPTYPDSKIIKIEYSYGGGFGTEAYTATKKITITKDEIVFSNDYNSLTETINVDTNKFNEVTAYIQEHMSIFDKDLKPDNMIADGNSSHILVELEDGTKYENGGYMITDKEYNIIKDKIYELFDRTVLDNYINRVSEY